MARLPKHFDKEPTEVGCEFQFRQNGGDIRDDRVSKVRQVVIDAFIETANKYGLKPSWKAEFGSVSQTSYDRKFKQ